MSESSKAVFLSYASEDAEAAQRVSEVFSATHSGRATVLNPSKTP